MPSCPQCDHENPPAARFCNACGTPLEVAEPARETRKTVTIVFCDVVGSTALGERFDPEVLRDLMSRFYAAIREPIERHGGTVEKVIGDAMMAVFGIPVVHEDDALRAVRAALEMRDAVRRLGDVQARIGVNTGDVLARDPTRLESLVVGDAVNVAARIEQAAKAGEVLVGEATWALVEHAVRGERVPDIAARGKQDGVVAWRLEAVDPGAVGHRRRLDLPLIGRESELDMLRWALSRAARVERPQLVFVMGQPGIGKSRLVAELGRIAEDAVLLTGRCSASPGSSSLAPLREIARAIIPRGIDPVAAVAVLMPGDPEVRAVAACIADETVGAKDLAWAVSRLLGAMAAMGTVVVVVEDVHWADDVLLDVLEQLVGPGRRGSLVVTCTARPDFVERRRAWVSGGNAVSVTLEPLDVAEARQLLTYVAPSLEREQGERIVAAAEGNPLFVEHLAALVGDGEVGAGFPLSIQVLLTARLEALSAPELEVMTIASVAGRDFPVAAVEALIGRPIVDDLDRLVRRELLEPDVASSGRFEHALLQEAAYRLVSKKRRSELHLALARWLDGDGADDAQVAGHLERAALLHAELGESDDAAMLVREEAGARLAAAGRRADAMGDPVMARLLLEHALDLLADESPSRPAAMVELAAAGWNLLTSEEVVRLLDGGAELAGRRGLRAVELRARILRLGVAVSGTADAVSDEEALAVTDAALRELDHLGDPRALASALCTRAGREWVGGAAAAALASARRAIVVLRSIDADQVWALQVLARCLVDAPISVAAGQEILRSLNEEFGVRPTARLELLEGQAILTQLQGDDDAAFELLRAAKALERDLGRAPSPWLVLSEAAMLNRSRRFADTRALLGPLLDDDLAFGYDRAYSVGLALLALAEASMGYPTHAPAAAADAIGYEGGVLGQLALCAMHLGVGAPDQAVLAAAQAVARAEVGDWLLLRADAAIGHGQALQAAGDVSLAAAEAQRAMSLYAEKGYPGGVAAARVVLAEIHGSPTLD